MKLSSVKHLEIHAQFFSQFLMKIKFPNSQKTNHSGASSPPLPAASYSVEVNQTNNLTFKKLFNLVVFLEKKFNKAKKTENIYSFVLLPCDFISPEGLEASSLSRNLRIRLET